MDLNIFATIEPYMLIFIGKDSESYIGFAYVELWLRIPLLWKGFWLFLI